MGGLGQAMGYAIDFENRSSATASVQAIRATDNIRICAPLRTVRVRG
jgi:hypothetical protein